MPSLQVRLARGLKLTADCSIDDCASAEWDAIACPGGMPGAENLRDSATLTALLKKQASAGKLTAAVCASPAVIFATHGILNGPATCYPAPQFKEKIDGWTDAQAVVDGHILTSQGPGTSLQFALAIVEAKEPALAGRVALGMAPLGIALAMSEEWGTMASGHEMTQPMRLQASNAVLSKDLQSSEALRDQLRDAREANHHVEVRELRSESESSSESVAW